MPIARRMTYIPRTPYGIIMECMHQLVSFYFPGKSPCRPCWVAHFNSKKPEILHEKYMSDHPRSCQLTHHKRSAFKAKLFEDICPVCFYCFLANVQ